MVARVGRISIVLLAVFASFAATNLVLEPGWGAAGWLTLAAAVGLGAGAWAGTASQHPLMRGAMLGAGWGGGIGFVYALIQPAMRSTENSLGAMIVLAVTWPAGVLLGAVLGTAIAAVRLR